MASAVPVAVARRNQWDGVVPLSWPLLGLVVGIDQLLLPMFHIGSMPFKPSYAICGLWLALWLQNSGRRPGTDISAFFALIGTIVGCALLGDLWLAANYTVSDHSDIFRSVLIYTLTALAFGVGISARGFKLDWLVPMLLAAATMNLLFIVFRSAMPGWIIDLYYPPMAVENLAEFGITDASGILEMARPRGLFGNPNTSAFMVNVIALFIYLGLRHRFMTTPRPLIGILIVVLPILVALTLASRGEMIVAAVLGVLNFMMLMRHSTATRRARLLIYAMLIPVAASIGLMSVFDEASLTQSIERVASIVDVVSNASTSSSETRDLGSVNRPLFMLKLTIERFLFSPLFGAGFSSTDGPPLEIGTQYFHNDWFRIVATSGLIGTIALLMIIARFVWPLGWPAAIPFVLPALVNTFLLNIPGQIFYFFMIAVLREKLRDRASGGEP